jgi:hydroxypyruvate isomerase
MAAAQAPTPIPRKGRVKQSAMQVNFPDGTPLETVCRESARAGCQAMDLVPAKDWPTVRKFGLALSTAPRTTMTIEDGIIRKELHPALETALRASLDECAQWNCRNVIVVGGQRHGMSYTEGADRCVEFLNRVKAHAEDKGVNIVLEIMNSKYTDPNFGRVDQVCDHLAFGVDVCRRVNSPRVKVLFDIYHVQIADGDVCANIRQNIQWIGHFHTGGVPGRHELDSTQELNYRFIAQTIADTGYTGYVAHEYRPSPGRDPAQSLAQAVEIMDV